MKKWTFSLLVASLAISLCAWAQSGSTNSNSEKTYGDQTQEKVSKRLDDSAADLNRLTGQPDNGIPQTVLAKAKCVAIVPSLVKGGFIFGAEHGRGVATCRLANDRWSGPALFTMTGGSWGAQIGGEAVDLVMLFMTDEGAKKLMAENWKIGGDVAGAAGPYGRDLSANTSWKFNTAILTYSRSKGAFVGATLNGTNIHTDSDAMKALYGGQLPNFRDVLTGKVAAPPAAHHFLAAVRTDFHEAAATK